MFLKKLFGFGNNADSDENDEYIEVTNFVERNEDGYALFKPDDDESGHYEQAAAHIPTGEYQGKIEYDQDGNTVYAKFHGEVIHEFIPEDVNDNEYEIQATNEKLFIYSKDGVVSFRVITPTLIAHGIEDIDGNFKSQNIYLEDERLNYTEFRKV